MSDKIEFSVDAVLGDATELQNQINQLKTNLDLKINNRQALNAIQTLQQRIDALRESAHFDFNLNGLTDDTEEIQNRINRMYGSIDSSNIAKRLGLQEFDTLDQRVQELAKNMSRITQQTITTDGKGNITGAIITYKDQLGNVVTETLRWRTVSRETVDGVTTENQKLVVTQMRYKDAIEQTANALNRLGADTGISINSSSISDVESLRNALSQSSLQWDRNGASIKQFSQHLDSAGNTITKFTIREKKLVNGVEVFEDTAYAISSADNQLRQYNRTQNTVINSQMNFTAMLSSAIQRFAAWGLAMKVWTTIGNGIKDCTNYIIDLNEAMTNIRVVTMDTQESTQSLLETYNELGQQLGANTLDVASGATDWLRQGFSTADTTELVKDSVILSKLALIDNAQATEYLTSALKGYQLEAQDAIGVIDQLVSIDLEAATSSADLAEAMSRTANLARSTGVEMNELLGMIATISEVTQSSASVVGNSMKTLFSRMSNISAKIKSGRNVA